MLRHMIISKGILKLKKYRVKHIIRSHLLLKTQLYINNPMSS